MVSGYLGNPASAFGHALLKFNSSDRTPAGTLFDVTFNFGALVPENEPTPVYIYKGLFGGYVSGFSDSHYYTQDLVYRRTEFRDMWEFELALPEESRTLLAFHLWEIVGKKFKYYFLSDNCASQLARILEIALDRQFTEESPLWYVPVELFHQLDSLDASMDRSLIRSARFIPSSQRILQNQFSMLSDGELVAARTLLSQENPKHAIEKELGSLGEEDRIDVLDAMLAYYQYRITADEPNAAPELIAAKTATLRDRLRLPPTNRAPDNGIAPIEPPSAGSPPILLATGAGRIDGNLAYAQFQWSPFHYGILDHTNMDGSELVVLDTKIGIDDRRNRLFLKNLDIIRIRNLDIAAAAIPGERNLSWHVRASVRSVPHGQGWRTEGLLRGGLGKSYKTSRDVTLYAGMDARVFTDIDATDLGPEAGLLLGYDNISAWIEGGMRYNIGKSRWTGHSSLEVQYRLGRQYAIGISARHEKHLDATLSLHYYTR